MTDRRGPERRRSSAKRPRRPRSADIEFTATVQADELRFVEPPETNVRFFGEPGHESAAGSDRTNLPEQVQVGVTYRNVRVDYRLASALAPPEHTQQEGNRRQGQNAGRKGPSP